MTPATVSDAAQFLLCGSPEEVRLARRWLTGWIEADESLGPFGPTAARRRIARLALAESEKRAIDVLTAWEELEAAVIREGGAAHVKALRSVQMILDLGGDNGARLIERALAPVVEPIRAALANCNGGCDA